MTDHLRRSRVVSIGAVQEVDGIEALVDELSPERRVSARQDLGRLAQAFDSLSDKCRDVVWFRRVEGLSQRETADRMGLKEDAIESQLSRGIRALARAISERPTKAIRPPRKRGFDMSPNSKAEDIEAAAAAWFERREGRMGCRRRGSARGLASRINGTSYCVRAP